MLVRSARLKKRVVLWPPPVPTPRKALESAACPCGSTAGARIAGCRFQVDAQDVGNSRTDRRRLTRRRAEGYHGSLQCAAKPNKMPELDDSLARRACVSISIKHCVEHDFLDLFRADLAACTQCVELLSPFVSLNRSSDYYAVLAALSVRSVPVKVYVRPRQEQPELLRSKYPEAIRNLESRGVRVLCRSGMHEKVAAVDGRILWHGSLNVLSHNDSRESMLRFESADLVQEILQDLGIQSDLFDHGSVGTDERADADQGPSAGPPCSVCRGPMRLYESAGIWLCNESPRCSGVRSVGSIETEAEAAALESRSTTIELNCPICDSPMVVAGIFRRQLSCPASGCGFQLEPRLSAGILRILSRRHVL
jgi:hypothetical protein